MNELIENLYQYLHQTVGVSPDLRKIDNNELKKIPIFIKETYTLYYGDFFFGNEFTVLIPKAEPYPTVGQIKKNTHIIEETLNRRTVVVFPYIQSYIRKRLIEAKINFIVPGKQLFMPNIRIDLNEQKYVPKKKTDALLPSAQCIIIHKILKRNDPIENYRLQDIADKLKYSPMAITKAANNIQQLNLCKLQGTKEKYINFHQTGSELWNQAINYLVNPVLKQVYVDEFPQDVNLLKSNASALPEYTNMADSRQEYYAIEKNLFYSLRKKNQLLNLNEYEGIFCLEVWKYNPNILAQNITRENNVDPLSLYLSMQHLEDERIEMALENILEEYLW